MKQSLNITQRKCPQSWLKNLVDPSRASLLCHFFYTKKTVQNVCKLEHHADLLKPGVFFFVKIIIIVFIVVVLMLKFISNNKYL